MDEKTAQLLLDELFPGWRAMRSSGHAQSGGLANRSPLPHSHVASNSSARRLKRPRLASLRTPALGDPRVAFGSKPLPTVPF